MNRYIVAVLLFQCFVGTWQSNATNPANTTQLTWSEILPNNCVLRMGSFPESCRGRQSDDGHFVTIDHHPWQVAIIRSRDKVLKCGGSIISKYHVLTAAHCFMKVASKETNENKSAYTTLLIAVGSSRYTESDFLYTIKELHIHDLYSHIHRRNDIALLKIDREFKWTRLVQPICLPAEDEQYTPGLQCCISGFGNKLATSPNDLEILQSGLVALSTDDHCRIGKKIRQVSIAEGMFCASGYEGPGVMIHMCQEDSGGPLHCEVGRKSQRVLFGITSVGHGCRFRNHQGVYTKVSNYLQWIRDRVEERGTTTPAPAVFLVLPKLKPGSLPLPRLCGATKLHMDRDDDSSTAAAVGVDSSIGKTPWLVSLMYWTKQEQSPCSGAIISENYVVTTAQCVADRVRPEMAYYISAGDTSLQEREREYNISRIITHPEYNSTTFLNDIALIELSEKFTFSKKIQPICMPYNELYEINRQAVFAVWYQTKNPSEMSLYRRIVNLIDKSNCSKKCMGCRNITDGMFCSVAGGNNATAEKSGPLIASEGVRHYLLGVFSWGRKGNDSNDALEVHTKVLNYIDWIKKVMAGEI